MGTAIEKNNVEQNAYDNIFEVMNNRSNIQDPRDPSNTGTSGRDFILNDDPEWKAFDASLLPYVVLKFPEVDYDSEQDSSSGQYKQVIWKHKIIVRVSRTGTNNRTPNTGKKDYLNICDDLHKTFNSLTNRNILSLLNMRKVKIVKTGHDEFLQDTMMIYEATFELSYSVRLQVSA